MARLFERPITVGDAEKRNMVNKHTEQRRSTLFLGVSVVAFVCYLALFLFVRRNPRPRADIEATIRFQRLEHPALHKLLNLISWLGFRPQSAAIPFTVISGWFVSGFRLETLFLGLAWMSSLFSYTTKLLVQRPRPSGNLIRITAAKIRDTSFPSGHTIHYVTFYGFASYLFFSRIRHRTVRWAGIVLAAPMIFLVGPSRIYLGHHWLTDVLASYLFGIAYLIGLISIYRRFRNFESGRIAQYLNRVKS